MIRTRFATPTVCSLVALVALTAASASAQQAAPQAPAPSAVALVADAQGKPLGSVTFTKYPQGVVLHGELSGLTPGWHGIHIHENGACSPDFKAAGGHFAAAGTMHGLGSDHSHYGELPNIWANDAGKAGFEAITQRVTLGDSADGLFKTGGTALVIHAQADDYLSQPAGNSGDRVGCGVITRK
ncbi:superoxide dismutase family protein [Azospirillum griseum]|uniref:Superoxide dismutase [Cu-Zn] n=1 Tax=Azospirillum griseum TaxID=2496639 RepID=A0A3S0K8R2_9PROT|nr:superoxide dismutase family protein [Azospirillum griseum]RTR16737.1 superoxide dismutase family protein [Azospirillum griseum]